MINGNDHYGYGGRETAEERHVAETIERHLGIQFERNSDHYDIDLVLLDGREVVAAIEVEGANKASWFRTPRPTRRSGQQWADFSLPLRKLRLFDEQAVGGIPTFFVKLSHCLRHWIGIDGAHIMERSVECKLVERLDELRVAGSLLGNDGRRCAYWKEDIRNAKHWIPWHDRSRVWQQYAFVCFPWTDPRIVEGEIAVIDMIALHLGVEIPGCRS